jgi:CTD small phosphatase-like protein 2
MANGTVIVKDLSKIGRDLSKCIIIDNVSDNFCLQPDNGIFIKTWYDDMTDTDLYDMIPLLSGKASDTRLGQEKDS